MTDSQESRKGKGTHTSAFGSPGRANHDSTEFYNSRLYRNQQPAEPEDHREVGLPPACRNSLFCKSSESMDELPDYSVHLMVTSPPYNASKEYDEDLTLGEYRDLLASVMSETYRVLVTGGRACINLANLGRKPYLPLHAFLIQDMLSIGFLMRGEIIWDKAGSAGSSTAWGSWLSASNPVLRDVHEYILVFCKETFSRPAGDRISTIQREDFLAWTKSVWSFPSVSARQIGHPAPFPEELPRRLIELYTYQDETVLDPFCGSGTTCLAAMHARRTYVGYDTHAEYIDLATSRLTEAASDKD